MASAGGKLLGTTTGKAAMIYNAFAQILHFYKLIKRITRYFKSNNIDLVIVCDSPAFNFHIAKAAKKNGIKTLFYVAPQLWAWAPWRIKKLRKYCHKLCCILPFEKNWFSERAVDTTFVGNPLFDELDTNLDRCKRQYTDFQSKNAKIALMPGSRSAEINTLWLPMQKIAVNLKRKFPNAAFTTVAVDEQRKQILKAHHILGFRTAYTIGSVNETARDCDFTIVASGSATLQVAAAGCPMIIMYQSSKIVWYLLGKWLINTKFLSLVNILADKELVPEFMPYFDSVDPIARTCASLLTDTKHLTDTSSELVELVKPLAEKNASSEAAKIVIDLLQ